MTCNSGRRKVFADELVASVVELAKKHGLDDVVVNRDDDPVLVAARGCLRDDKDEKGESIELVMQISPDIAKADERSTTGAQLAADGRLDVFRAFDLSEVVAKETVAYAAKPEDEDCTPDDRPSHK